MAGTGTYCEVWQVRDSSTGHRCALKRLRETFLHDSHVRAMFVQEIRATQRVRSPYIVQALLGDVDADKPWLLLEWLEGITLEELLQRHRRVSIQQAVWIARQCAAGMADLERAGLAHGDIKPANIFVLPTGTIKLIDLGFTRPLRGTPTERRLMGTADYLPPESLSRESTDPVAGDIYSLGVVLFRMLAGRLPFAGESTADVLRGHREARPPLLRRWCPEAPRELADLISRMLAKHPLRRPASLSHLLRELIALELMLIETNLASDAASVQYR